VIEKANILIPDITGYTGFLSKTAIGHSTHIINELLEVIVQHSSQLFSVAEIEGDAVLLYRKGEPLSRGQLIENCINIFKEFHRFRKIIERDSICKCGACQGATNLCLKFVAHYGEIHEMKIGPFSKPTGFSLIVAHRLLKNSIKEDSYILISQDLSAFESTEKEDNDLNWFKSSDEYPDIGKVEYECASLTEVKKDIPDPPGNPENYHGRQSEFVEVDIETPIKSVYNILIDPNTKYEWSSMVDRVETDVAIERVGTTHLCVLKDEGGTVEIKNEKTVDDGKTIEFVDNAKMLETGIQFFNYFKLTKENDNRTHISSCVGPLGDNEIPREVMDFVLSGRGKDFELLKDYCEKTTLNFN